jgi:hypothetical protein
MPLAQPETFVLTDAEAAAVQAAQLARQASVARASPVLLAASIAVPVVLVAVVYAVDLIWYEGAMPLPLFVTLMAVFFAGMVVQTLAYRLTLEASKRRLRRATRQVFAPRTVRLTDEGIEQAQPQARAFNAWSGIDRAEQAHGLILLWAGNLLAVAVPVRAFPAPQDADAFLDACRQRARPASG